MTSSSTQPGAASRRRGRRWTLRTRLVLVILTLVTLTSLIIGGASVLVLNSFFTERLDAQVSSAAQRSQVAFERDQDRQGRQVGGNGQQRLSPSFLLAPGQGPGTLGAVIESEEVSGSAVLDQDGSSQSLPDGTDSALLAIAPDSEPTTVELGAELGDYRAVAVQVDPDTRVVTALSETSSRDAVSQVITVIAVSAAAALALAALAAAAIVHSTLRPLRRVADTANQVSTMPLASGEVTLAPRVPARDTDPDTEVGQVGAALNQMLEHVEHALTERETSQQRMRQFIADASHELRTPLASIMGYSELIRRGPQPIAAETDHALSRVENQAKRMNTLVEDLLLLARMDADPQMQFADVDLRPLVADALSDAQVAGPGHHWSLAMPKKAVMVRGDAERLHQVIANVLRNAHRHTPEGSAVSVSLTVNQAGSIAARRMPGQPAAQPHKESARAVLTIADNGPGIPAHLQSQVFERFARGDTSRSRSAGSTGLGLAIVAAIVQAHHGSVEVRSEPGNTSFVIRLALLAPRSSE
ncbi:MAG: HAMP domain-containing sensor histidine kinase [Ornithinimicrobium sp.]